MTRTSEPNDRPASLPLADLFTRYLGRQAEAAALGLGHAESTGDVEPYEAVPVQPVEPRLAWTDAVAAAALLSAEKVEWPVPPEWPVLVAAEEPAVMVSFALGNFPQLVRDLQPLVARSDAVVSRKPAPPLAVTGLTAWAERQKSYPVALLAAGVLRVAQHFDSAESVLGQAEKVPAAWRAVHANEAAALAWHRGRHAEALAMWEAQPASVPVLFNRGMALLFLGRATEAREPLTQAVARLKETNAWYHLGQLYLTLANSRG
jgi:tetratricopeptide (TPR) repeat protein